MIAVLNVVLPVFGIVLAGYLCGRFGVLGAASSEALNAFVYYVALPALFFVSMARVPLSDILNWPFLFAYGGGALLAALLAVFAGGLWFRNRVAEQGLHGLSAIFSNTGYMGIPLLITAFGQDAALPAIIATVLNGAVVMAIGIVIVEVDISRGQGLAHVLADAAKGVLKSPLVLSAAAGIAYSLSGFAPPVAVATFCDILGAAAPPSALFAIGLFMVGRSFAGDTAEITWLVFFKLLVQPAITALIAYSLLDMAPLWSSSAITLAALPTGALVFVLAQQYGVYTRRATAVILASTILSVVTLSVLFALLGVK
jgi:predicted permease